MGEIVTLEEWVAGQSVDFQDEGSEQAYKRRAERFRDAIRLQEPDRVPAVTAGGLLAADFADLSFEEAMYDPEKLGEASVAFTTALEPDALPRTFTPLARMLDELGYNLINWPGGQLDSESPFQFVEDEYMKAEDYDELLRDPTGFFLRTYAPRIADGLKGFEELPLIANPMFDAIIPAFGAPGPREALENLLSAAKKGFEDQRIQAEYNEKLKAMGYPDITGGISEAPFDALGDTIRGTKDVMIDIRKRPEKLKEALELFEGFMVEIGVGSAIQSNTPFVFIPLHKGSDAFLSKADYEEFYWPTLKGVMESLTEMGLIPIPFAEGAYNERLEILDGDLPDGEIIWWFDQTDMDEAKAVLGDQACLMGNVPSGLLKTGSAAEVREYCTDLIDGVGPEGLILTPGCTPNRAPFENLKAMIDAPTQV